jgi:hypothetical protein
VVGELRHRHVRKQSGGKQPAFDRTLVAVESRLIINALDE